MAESGFTRFPPRLPIQPLFYPVLDRAYAEQIARDWNTKDEASGFAGFVVSFEVDTEFLSRYPIKVAGASDHRELWVPAEELEAFNSHIRSPILAIATYTGPGFRGEIDADSGLPTDLTAYTQRFEVWRQDDNGVRAKVRGDLTQGEAEALAAELEAKGHKQMYWVKVSGKEDG